MRELMQVQGMQVEVVLKRLAFGFGLLIVAYVIFASLPEIKWATLLLYQILIKSYNVNEFCFSTRYLVMPEM